MHVMSFAVKRAGVVGAGVMGAAIAAHFTNVGIPVLLLDIPSKEDGPRDAIAKKGLDAALKAKPALFYDAKSAGLITTGTIDDNLQELGECDVVVEAIVERLDVKRDFFARLAAVRAPHTVVSSNTSGISINAMAEGLPEDFRRNFLVTHFFNPVRYMKLLEIVPNKDTDPTVVEQWSSLGRDTLGKGVVICKDTPNFIANRLGVYGFMALLKRTLDEGYSVEEIDAVFGEPMGRPGSAVFRTCDLSGLDVLLHVSQGVYDNVPDDDEREVFLPPAILREMVSRGWLGNKSGQGFYKRVKGAGGSETLVLDLKTLEYHPRAKVRFASVDATRDVSDPGKRVAALIEGTDRAAKIARAATLDMLAYSCRHLTEIADSAAEVDKAMRWGYFWSQGPFQTIDAIGVSRFAALLREDGREVPALIEKMIEKGQDSFYGRSGDSFTVVSPVSLMPELLPASPADVTAANLAAAGKTIVENESARLLDMGDGVALLEYRSKLNTIDDKIIMLTREALDRAANGAYRALVIGNDAADFSVGANLAALVPAIQEGQWDDVEKVVKAFQDVCMAVKYAPIPVVVAGAGRTLGGGAEVVMHSARSRVAAEWYAGLVECGVGLVPAGGGCKELLIRYSAMWTDEHGPFPVLRKVFEQIAFAKVGTSAAESRVMGFLRPNDAISLDRERLLADAKADAIALAEADYATPPQALIQVTGPGGRLVIEQQLAGFHATGLISDHDVLVNTKLAYVLSGGMASPIEPVTEQHILDLEREAFLSLAGTPKTQERITHTLTTGKPLRN